MGLIFPNVRRFLSMSQQILFASIGILPAKVPMVINLPGQLPSAAMALDVVLTGQLPSAAIALVVLLPSLLASFINFII